MRFVLMSFFLFLYLSSDTLSQDNIASSIFELGSRFEQEKMEKPSWLLYQIAQELSNGSSSDSTYRINKLQRLGYLAQTLQCEVLLPKEDLIVLQPDDDTRKIEIAWNWKNQKDIGLFNASGYVLGMSNGHKIAFVRQDSLGKSIVFRLGERDKIIWKTVILENGYDSSGPPVSYYSDIKEGISDVVIMGNRGRISFAVFVDKENGIIDKDIRIDISEKVRTRKE